MRYLLVEDELHQGQVILDSMYPPDQLHIAS